MLMSLPHPLPQDQDQEVKECAISCMAAAVAALGDALGADVAQVRLLCSGATLSMPPPTAAVAGSSSFARSFGFGTGWAAGRPSKHPRRRLTKAAAALAAPSVPQVGALAEEFAELPPPRAAGRAKKRAKTEPKKPSPAAKAAQPAAAAGEGPEVGCAFKCRLSTSAGFPTSNSLTF